MSRRGNTRRRGPTPGQLHVAFWSEFGPWEDREGTDTPCVHSLRQGMRVDFFFYYIIRIFFLQGFRAFHTCIIILITAIIILIIIMKRKGPYKSLPKGGRGGAVRRHNPSQL